MYESLVARTGAAMMARLDFERLRRTIVEMNDGICKTKNPSYANYRARFMIKSILCWGLGRQ